MFVMFDSGKEIILLERDTSSLHVCNAVDVEF